MEEGEEGDERLVEAGVVGDGEEFEGFQGSGRLALLKRPSGADSLEWRSLGFAS